MQSPVPARVRHLLLVFLVAGLAPCSAGAHDIGASNATFLVRATGIDVELYMSLGSGALLIADNGEQIVIKPATFPDFSQRLQAVAPALFDLTAGDGTTLEPDSFSVSLTEQNDACYDLHYPLPAAMPGTLTIHAAYMERMAPGHVGSIYVMNTAGDRFGSGEVTADSMDVQAHLPAALALQEQPPAGPAQAVSAPAAAPGPSSGESRQSAPWFLWVLLGGSALLIAAAALRGAARQSAERKASP
jgi:hypothetical protein